MIRTTCKRATPKDVRFPNAVSDSPSPFPLLSQRNPTCRKVAAHSTVSSLPELSGGFLTGLCIGLPVGIAIVPACLDRHIPSGTDLGGRNFPPGTVLRVLANRGVLAGNLSFIATQSVSIQASRIWQQRAEARATLATGQILSDCLWHTPI